MRVTVVVPARDAAATIGRTLACLRRQSLSEPYEVIVADDGSSDDTAAIAERTGVTVLRLEAAGPASARNAGAAAGSGELLAFTDADCLPSADWLAAGVAAFDEADLVQGAVEPEAHVPMGPFDRSLWVRGESGLYESANLLVRRSVFDRVGGFEEWIKPVVGKSIAEDVWFGWRARRAGARTAFAPDAVVRHAVIRRGALEYVADRRRLVHFPQMVAQIPELRDTFMAGHVFLGGRTAAFDLALIGAATALARRSARPLAAGLPYALLLTARWRRRTPVVAPVEVAADAVGLVALVRGSIRHRTVVL